MFCHLVEASGRTSAAGQSEQQCTNIQLIMLCSTTHGVTVKCRDQEVLISRQILEQITAEEIQDVSIRGSSLVVQNLRKERDFIG